MSSSISRDLKDFSPDIDWQFESLLEQCQSLVDNRLLSAAKLSPGQAAVQSILQAYLTLARQFYEQYKNSLWEAYNQAPTPSEKESHLAVVSKSMQVALDRLVTEWNRVYSIIAAIQASGSSSKVKKITESLAVVVEAAIRDVGLSPKTFPIVLQFGESYNMRFFNYTDALMILGLPLPASKSPWEWTILWHEIAGQRIRLLKSAHQDFQELIEKLCEDTHGRQSYINDRSQIEKYLEPVIRKHFKPFQTNSFREQAEFMTALSQAIGEDLQKHSASSLAGYRKWDRANNRPYDATDLPPRTAINQFYWDQEQPLVMLSFDGLLADILSELPTPERQAAIAAGWSAQWLEQLFEDAVSVLNFDVQFLPVFANLLSRHRNGGKGKSHPPRNIRLAVAVALKVQSAGNEYDCAQPPEPWPALDEPGLSDEDQLKSFQKQFDYHKLVRTDQAQKMAWRVACRLRALIARMMVKVPRDPAGRTVKAALDQAMADYLDGGDREVIFNRTRRQLPQALLRQRPPVSQISSRRLVTDLLTNELSGLPRTYQELDKIEFGYVDFADPTTTTALAGKTTASCSTCGGIGAVFDPRFTMSVTCRSCGGTGRLIA